MAGLMIAIANSISSNYVSGPAGPSYDPDAEAFFTAEAGAGVTLSDTEKTAINTLVVNLKAANIWSKMKALYPFIGSTATSQKFNLKDPRDLDAAFRLAFTGGWTHSSNGALPNGTNAYADTFLSPSSTLTNNNTHLSFYSRTNTAINSSEMGALSFSTSLQMHIKWSDGNLYFDQYNGTTNRITYANANSQGFYTSTRTASNSFKAFKNGSQVGSTDTASQPNNVTTISSKIYISAFNNAGTTVNYSNKQVAFSSIGDGLTDLESQVFNQIVEGYQFSLGRNINPNQSFYYNTAYNNETNAYLYSTQITDTTTQVATNTLVNDLKAAGVWTKMKAVYPMAGSTATTQKYNLVNSQDTNAAFRLSFVGGWTHTSNGALANGSNAYANSFLIPSSVLTANNTHLSVYIGTDTVAGNKIEMGVGVGGTLVPIMMLMTKYTGNLAYSNAYNLTTNQLTSSNTDARGFYVGSRTSSTSHKLYKSGTIIGTDTNANTNTLPTQGILIGALNSNGSIVQYSDRRFQFITIGDGLTDLESQVFNQIVEGYQFALGRNINPTQSFYYNTAYNNETNAYLYSTQITDTTTQVATNTLVNDLKAAGVWTKMKAVYPMAGSTATTQKYNLVNSQDTNAAFRLSFVGGWTHSSLGATPNGTNAYADTFLTPSTSLSLNSTHVSYYSRVNSNATEIEVGVATSSTAATILEIRTTGVTYYRVNSAVAYVTYTDSNSLGFYVANRTASNVINGWKNGTKVGTASTLSTSLPSVKLYLAALNNSGVAQNYSIKQCAFASIGDGLTDAEAADFYTAVQNFQISLGRAIYLSPPTVSDSDAQAFINAATIVDQAEATAINDLVIGLKADSLWTKMKAVYPLVGSSATSQKYNLKNPLDTNAAFRLVFNGGWTHSFNGITGNGTNTYADTYVLGGTNITGSNYGYGVYINTEADQNTQDVGVGANSHLIANFGGLTYFRGLELYIDGTYLNNSSKGFFHQYGKAGSGESSTGFINGTKRATLNGPGYLDAANVYVGGRTLYSSKRYCFGFVSDKLTDTEATNLYNRTQTFNTTLNRQV